MNKVDRTTNQPCERLAVTVQPEIAERLREIAQEEYDGNVSRALRKILKEHFNL